ncbi:MAG: hypothetical protein JO086_10950, partial [Acidimicrobiia bacterium]|nr:hypothetical protein [Acidimicrobiia bacterium]
DFQLITRSRTVPDPVDTGSVISGLARELLDQVDVSPGVRLLGVSVSNLAQKQAQQLSLEDAVPLRDDATRAVDEVRRRFGPDAVGPAALVGDRGLRLKRRGEQQWGPGDDKRP